MEVGEMPVGTRLSGAVHRRRRAAPENRRDQGRVRPRGPRAPAAAPRRVRERRAPGARCGARSPRPGSGAGRRSAHRTLFRPWKLIPLAPPSCRRRIPLPAFAPVGQ